MSQVLIILLDFALAVFFIHYMKKAERQKQWVSAVLNAFMVVLTILAMSERIANMLL